MNIPVWTTYEDFKQRFQRKAHVGSNSEVIICFSTNVELSADLKVIESYNSIFDVHSTDISTFVSTKVHVYMHTDRHTDGRTEYQTNGRTEDKTTSTMIYNHKTHRQTSRCNGLMNKGQGK